MVEVTVAAVGLVIPAAGLGERLGVGMPKALFAVGGESLLVHAVRAGTASGVVTSVVVAAPMGQAASVHSMIERELPAGAALRVVDGGATRQASVRAALAELPADVRVVLVHDAARCLAPAALFADVAAAVAGGDDAVVPGLGVVDTLKEVGPLGEVIATPDRSRLRAVQTPQGFTREILERAHHEALRRGDNDVSDDAGLVERIGCPVRVIPGHAEAFKVTRPLDVELAEAVLTSRRGTVEESP
ncbi:2-C-methyl-D-erythritol 4-phosphate cytidylyltransferase [Phytoactinopolyspora alkaliphila]|uniref:2-C-methyl-D-erythritol 4-phosphate cytidylyltransferase n=1 Tax=Phytoactinopolyspora alkaliphila TaxID=1783498 RepID=A0A6N9YIQ1_9ACTN|nr:2-C-methyl-D-erythritol 4-phosphate cytidylyltransferase [Phytoactinopolyspora alkaliphila]